MKAYSIDWSDRDKNSTKSGVVLVIADSVVRAISRFEREFDPRRVVESVQLKFKEVLSEGADC